MSTKCFCKQAQRTGDVKTCAASFEGERVVAVLEAFHGRGAVQLALVVVGVHQQVLRRQ